MFASCADPGRLPKDLISIHKLKRFAPLCAILALFILAAWALASGQEVSRAARAKGPEAVGLFPKETIQFAMPPPVMVVSGIKCDLSGNIFMVYSDAPPDLLLPAEVESDEHRCSHRIPKLPRNSGLTVRPAFRSLKVAMYP